MKLLFCYDCYDVFKLDVEERSCKCGHVTGRYIDNTYAETNGKGISLAIGNGSLMSAIQRLVLLKKREDSSDGVLNYNRNIYIDDCKINYAWVRPNEGNGNPHTRVKKEK